MFNNLTKGRKMETQEKNTFWLVIEKYTYAHTTPSHTVKKTASSLEEAIEFKVALEKLNEQQDVSYFLASDVDTVLEKVAYHHNKSVENGSYDDKHQEMLNEVTHD
jgi:hypothetical protein